MNFESSIDELVDRIDEFFFDTFQYRNMLELFAGDGSLYTKKLNKNSEVCIGCEIDGTKEEGFKTNIHQGIFIQTDSIGLTKLGKVQEIIKKYNINLLSIDNPLGIFGDSYVEHFDILGSLSLMFPPGDFMLLIDVVTKPYSYEEHSQWKRLREDYYGTDASYLSDDFLKDFYSKLIINSGMRVNGLKVFNREKVNNENYFSVIACYITKE